MSVLEHSKGYSARHGKERTFWPKLDFDSTFTSLLSLPKIDKIAENK